MEELRRILKKVLKSTPQYDARSGLAQLEEAWPEIVGERAARHCRPARLLDDGTLLVAAESSVWLQSLHYLEAQILQKLKDRPARPAAQTDAGGAATALPAVKRLRFIVG